ncbi:hypothetical protein CAEBREN_13595 [Caenorhabditis brenneri]|uniref:Uncharacterized protein n=1 Tax=Caenorhabditis brenneri TaxID=135651 RepID=G0NCY4_CAEBE|nr:hypothetical protein CAEBREN_13595 [Caenorhabditis brenneri]
MSKSDTSHDCCVLGYWKDYEYTRQAHKDREQKKRQNKAFSVAANEPEIKKQKVNEVPTPPVKYQKQHANAPDDEKLQLNSHSSKDEQLYGHARHSVFSKNDFENELQSDAYDVDSLAPPQVATPPNVAVEANERQVYPDSVVNQPSAPVNLNAVSPSSCSSEISQLNEQLE